MTKILVDANNYIRRLIERDTTGSPIRSTYNQMAHNLAVKGDVFLVWDGFKGNEKRKLIYPEYKGRRMAPQESIFQAFKMVEEICYFAPIIQIKMPGYEADDVIASLAIEMAKKEDVAIVSSDYDFMQLRNKSPRIFVGAEVKNNVDPDQVPYYKVTVGDPSDNIPGIPGFGQGSWDNADKSLLRRYIDDIVAGGDGSSVDIKLPVRAKPNPDDIRKYWQIVQFFDIPITDIAPHFKPGSAEPLKAYEYLRDFML